MARKQRDYKAEYARRIAKGRERGLSRTEARGHKAEKRGRLGVSPELLPEQVPGYLDRLAERRSVKVVGYTDDGGTVTLGRGKPRAMANWFRETLESDSLGASLAYEESGKAIVMVRVFFQ